MSRDRVDIVLRPAAWPMEARPVREILREYLATLPVDLDFQDVEGELAALPGDYAPPAGLLLLAFVDGTLAACGGFRPLQGVEEANACEMKRLFVRPAFRGFGLGRGLGQALLDEAHRVGYRAMFLDTMDDMVSARALYGSLGFVEVPPYCFNPLPGVHFLKTRLDRA